MGWFDVKHDSHSRILEKCCELYVAAHKFAAVPQTTFPTQKLRELLDCNPDPKVKHAYNRHRPNTDADQVEPVLMVRAYWPKSGTPSSLDDIDKIDFVIFLNKSICRKPECLRSLDGAEVRARGLWNLSFGTSATPQQLRSQLYTRIKRECLRQCKSLKDQSEDLVLLDVERDSSRRFVDKLVETFADDDTLDLSQKTGPEEVESNWNAWRRWGRADKQGRLVVTFTHFQAK